MDRILIDSWKFLRACSSTDVGLYLDIPLPDSLEKLKNADDEAKQKIYRAANQLDIAYSNL